jgi:hypothetical protein
MAQICATAFCGDNRAAILAGGSRLGREFWQFVKMVSDDRSWEQVDFYIAKLYKCTVCIVGSSQCRGSRSISAKIVTLFLKIVTKLYDISLHFPHDNAKC